MRSILKTSQIFFIARLSLSFLAFIPFIVLYAREIGLDFTRLMMAESVFAILVVIFDIPFGHLADRIGLKKALLGGAFSQGTACLLLFFFPMPVVFWLSQILFAFSLAFSRGADSAFNHFLLEREGRVTLFEKNEARVIASVFIVEVIAFIAGGFLSTFGYRFTFLITGCAQFVGLFLLFNLGADTKVKDEIRISLKDRLHVVTTEVASSPALLLQCVSMIFIGGVFSTVLYLLPALIRESGVNDIALGIFFAGVSVVASGFSHWVLKWDHRIGIFLILGVSALCGLWLPYWPILFFCACILKTARSILIPHFQTRAMDDLGQYGRATAMSVVTSAMSVGFAVMSPFLGMFVDKFGIRSLALVSMFLFLVGAFFQRLSQAYYRKSSEQITASWM